MAQGGGRTKKQSKAKTRSRSSSRRTVHGAEFLRRVSAAVKPHLTEATDLPAFLATVGRLSPADRQLLVEQALVLLELNYTHLPLKRAIHAIDPVQRLKLLKFRLAETKRGELPGEIQFHDEMQAIFTSLRDLHTNYLLPSPFKEKTAILPFLIEEYFEDEEHKFLVSHLNKGFRHPTFKVGVEVLYWNGVPLERAIELNGENQAGSNADARFANGLYALTIRPLVISLPPDEEWVVVTYRAFDGRELELKQKWVLVSAEAVEDAREDDSGARRTVTKVGLDLQTALINRVRKVLFAPEAVAAMKRAAKTKRPTAVANKDGLKSSLPDVIHARKVETPDGNFAYIRLFTFEEDEKRFVKEFARLAALLPQNGLIIDMRGNGGGNIPAGEELLQLLTPRRIEPETFEFINTPLNLELCRTPSEIEDLSPWADSIAESVMTGATYSRGFMLTPEDESNALGQMYHGPVVLITDALCYSTTDMFSAGFQDHEIGEIIGTSGNTGAGGANVWKHGLLRRFMSEVSDSPFKPLPHGADMRVALRRSLRVGQHSGVPLEELGVIPNQRYRMSKADLLNGNVDLINYAAQLLSQKTVRQLDVTHSKDSDGTCHLIATTENISRLDVFLDERPRLSIDVTAGTTTFAVAAQPHEKSVLKLQGYDDLELVAARRLEV